MRKIRICYTLNTFDLGGAETVALDLARHHDPAHFEVDVVALVEPRRGAESAMRERFRAAGVNTVALTQASYRSPLALARIFAFMRRGQYDIVHGHNRGADYWGARMARLAGVRCVSWTRHLMYHDMQAKQAMRYRALVRDGAGVIAVSKAVERACWDFEGIESGAISTIVNGIDLDRFTVMAAGDKERVRGQLGVEPLDHVVLFVARFAEAKAPEAFVDLMCRLRGRDPRIRGFMCGYGPLEETVRSLAAASDGAVTVLGVRQDIPELLGACDLFVSTSRNEGLPLNLMEAMATGSAFVAPAIAPIVELLDNQPVLLGQLVAPLPAAREDVTATMEEWTTQVQGVLADQELRQQVGACSRAKMLDEYSVQRMTSRYEDFFRDRLAGPARRG